MIYKCKIFGSKVPDIILMYALNYPYIFNQKGYADIKHKLNIFTPKHQMCK